MYTVVWAEIVGHGSKREGWECFCVRVGVCIHYFKMHGVRGHELKTVPKQHYVSISLEIINPLPSRYLRCNAPYI